MRNQLIAATICSALIFGGCAYWEAIQPIVRTLIIDLLRSLDTDLSAFEKAATFEAANPTEQLQLTAIQNARRALIQQIIDCILEQDPSIDLSVQIKRLRDATAPVPLAESWP